MSARDAKRSRRGHHKAGHHGHRGSQPHDRQSSSHKDSASTVDESNPVIQQFRVFREDLDARHDKYERIVKLSRDITIESKRTIFLLHRMDMSEESRSVQVLEEAETKLAEVQQSRWLPVAQELQGEDPYQFLRAYSPGLQEYIEALSLLHYLKDKSLIPLLQVENTLKFTVETPKASESVSDTSDTPQSESQASQGDSQEDIPVDPSTPTKHMDAASVCEKIDISVHVPPIEYILGIADLSGELMRLAIHSVGMGDLGVTFDLCEVIRVIHDAFLTFGKVHRELPRKLTTLKQSLRKVETACYTLQIRGSEIPKHMLADVFSSQATIDGGRYDDEEGNE